MLIIKSIEMCKMDTDTNITKEKNKAKWKQKY